MCPVPQGRRAPRLPALWHLLATRGVVKSPPVQSCLPVSLPVSKMLEAVSGVRVRGLPQCVRGFGPFPVFLAAGGQRFSLLFPVPSGDFPCTPPRVLTHVALSSSPVLCRPAHHRISSVPIPLCRGFNDGTRPWWEFLVGCMRVSPEPVSRGPARGGGREGPGGRGSPKPPPASLHVQLPWRMKFYFVLVQNLPLTFHPSYVSSASVPAFLVTGVAVAASAGVHARCGA